MTKFFQNKVFLFAAAIILIGGFFVAAPFAHAATPIYVNSAMSDDNGDGLTVGTAKKLIQSGINLVDAGGTVNVAAGTYTENVTITEPLSLLGAGRTTTTVQGVANTYVLTVANADGVLIQGLHITHPTLTVGVALGILAGSKHVTVRDCAIDHVGNSSLTNTSIHGIEVGPSTEDTEIANNLISDIVAQSGYDIMSGITIYGNDDASLAQRVNIHDNTFSNIHYLDESIGASLFGRAVQVSVYAKDVTINHNDITDTYAGIVTHSYAQAPITITNNTITASGYGLRLFAPDHIVTGNSISGSWIGINVRPSSAVPNTYGTYDNNIVFNNTTGVNFYPNTVGGNFEVANNSIYGNSTGFLFSGTGVIDASLNWWENVNGPQHTSNTFNVGSQGSVISGNVNFTPWLNNGTDTAPATPGFQPAENTSFAPVYANADGSTTETEQYSSVQSAVSGTNLAYIKVKAGTYKEQLNITKGVTLVGDVVNPDNVVIDGENKTNLTSDGQVRIYNPTGPVVFKGFKIINGGEKSGGGYYAILTKGDYSRTIQNNKLIGHGSSVGLGEDYGMWAYAANGELTVSNNYLTNFYHGILLEQQYGASTIENNTFDALYTGTSGDKKYGGRAIEAINYGSTDVTSLQKFSGNKFLNFVSTGIQITGGFSGQTPRKFTNVLIENNDFNFSTTDIVNLNGAIYLANISASNNDPAGGVTASINNNYIHVPSGNGVVVSGLNGNINLHSNSIVGNSVYGVKADGSLGPVINASQNWWGNTSGPSDSGPGTGYAVSTNVTFNPWFTNDGMTALNTYTSATVTASGVLPTGITDVVLNNSTVLNLSNATTTISSSATVGGILVVLTQEVTLQSGVDTQPVILINSALPNVSVSIPDNTTIQGPSGWDGTITPPISGTPDGGDKPAGFSVGGVVINVGSPEGTLVFDIAHPVTLLLAGVTGTVGYRPSGSDTWTQITSVCGGTYDAPETPTYPGECSISFGGNTKIVTYHFTSFGEFIPDPTPTPPPSHGGSVISAVPATKNEECKPGELFNGTTGKSCTVKATPATPSITPQVLGVKVYADSQLEQILTDAVAIYSENIDTILANAKAKRDSKAEKNTSDKYLNSLTHNEKNFSSADANRLNFFITYGTAGTKILGAGERAGVINSYKAAFGKLPKTEAEWQDAIKIANGRWPSARSEAALTKAQATFKAIYGRVADMNNANDNAAVTVMAYGLRPSLRNLNSEKASIISFKYFIKHAPVSAIDWDTVRAIAYSGAKR